jgi:hypothetical protein
MALSANKPVTEMASTDRKRFELPLAADAVVFAGSAVVFIDGYGYVKAAVSGANLRSVGIAEHAADNTGGAAGDVKVWVQNGIFKFKNAGSNTLTGAHQGSLCYFDSDDTVSSNSSSQSVAGRVVRVDSDGVFVHIDHTAAA